MRKVHLGKLPKWQFPQPTKCFDNYSGGVFPRRAEGSQPELAGHADHPGMNRLMVGHREVEQGVLGTSPLMSPEEIAVRNIAVHAQWVRLLPHLGVRPKGCSILHADDQAAPLEETKPLCDGAFGCNSVYSTPS